MAAVKHSLFDFVNQTKCFGIFVISKIAGEYKARVKDFIGLHFTAHQSLHYPSNVEHQVRLVSDKYEFVSHWFDNQGSDFVGSNPMTYQNGRLRQLIQPFRLV